MTVKVYEALREVKEDEKIAPQAQVVLDALKKGPLTREKLVAAVEKKLGENTVQPATRIVSFYTPRLVEAKLIKVTEQEVEEKPARKAATKKNAQ